MHHLTEKQQENLLNLNTDVLIEILQIIEERIGLVSIEVAAEAFNKSERWVYDAIKRGDIKTLKIADKNIIAINI